METSTFMSGLSDLSTELCDFFRLNVVDLVRCLSTDYGSTATCCD
ncbi:hypothetical protein MPTK1_3g10930 [Marchantia polymorpha subsp. ruderalis]|uniref:Uncharacterized protein n=2 Tax=Marchantia polymorpha TaxID=3197 RepID=A0AAF6AZJ0_MARPO|nr:hypothetical protein MARPO_0037s0103 [Marchantia polymorpha]BBN05174.1 hypothetical protein Mp_3g10930 [Marchantia polymorpha subsp. ruderalis]|eukprot:PTQ40930.1 hypothetical protein MARPO_0037s0103 [Marchantia polymorpha]